MQDPGAIATVRLACEHLCLARADLHLQPALAARWSQGASAAEWIFELREGVRFHDGSPLTADDVVTSFERLLDPAIRSPAMQSFRPAGVRFTILSPGGVRKLGDYTIVFELDRPYVDFPYLVSSCNPNTVILPRTYEPGGFVAGGIGSGPFVLAEYRPGEGASFRRYPSYWAAGLPRLDRVELSYLDGVAALARALQGGRLDLCPQVPIAGSEDLFADPDVRVMGQPSSEYRALVIRSDRLPFEDPRVRQALALCLDRSGLVEGLLGGHGQIGDDHGFAPVFPQVQLGDGVPRRSADLGKARQLLAEAGYPSGLTATIATERRLELVQYARFLREQCAPGGIRLELETQPAAAASGGPLLAPLALVAWAATGCPGQLIEPAYPCSGAANGSGWCDVRFGRLMVRFDAERDEGLRASLAARAARRQQQGTPAVIGYWLDGLRAAGPSVRGVDGGPLASFDPAPLWLAS
jgi:peptide/nickel transport system substrate-binding protein